MKTNHPLFRACMRFVETGFHLSTRKTNLTKHCLAFALALSASLASSAQTPDFPLPVATGRLGQKDPAAWAEVLAHLQAAAASNWKDVEATGTLTYPAGDTHAASLFLLGSRYSRLDVTMDSGTRSVRLISTYGRFKDETGVKSPLLPITSRAALVAFPRIWIKAAAAGPISLFDKGTIATNGQNLHRITFEFPLGPGTYSPGDRTEATDLYFDPNTHLLLFSVDSLRFANSANQPFLRVISYGNYQRFAGILFPTALTETLNGQVQWNLQLAQFSVNANPPSSTFLF